MISVLVFSLADSGQHLISLGEFPQRRGPPPVKADHASSSQGCPSRGIGRAAVQTTETLLLLLLLLILLLIIILPLIMIIIMININKQYYYCYYYYYYYY